MTLNGKPIIVATDLSVRSDRAVDRAVFLAWHWGSRLAVVHALEPGSRLERHPEHAEKVIRSILPDPDADVDIIPALGPAPTTILNVARSIDCGLIVTGVARFNHVGDFLTGTAVDHVVRHATVPVLVTKQRPRGAYRSILVATDFSSCSRSALITVARLFPDAAIHLVRAYNVPYEAWLNSEGVRQEIEAELRAAFDTFISDPSMDAALCSRIKLRLEYGETVSVVSRVADELEADLVVVGTHGRSGFAQAVMGSMASSLLSTVRADTLMVREPR